MKMSKRPLHDFCSRLSWEELDPAYLRRLAALARDEDLYGAGLNEVLREKARGDVTSALLPSARGEAELRARRAQVVCGLNMIPLLLEAYGGGVEFHPAAEDGAQVKGGDSLGWLVGNVPTMLQAERVVLNFLQRLSGVATTTRTYVERLLETETLLLDTRKTTPGFRMLEKYAVASGGGWNHRLGLFDRVMLKDNHLAAAGWAGGTALEDAVRVAVERHPELIVQVEVDSLEQIPPVLDAGAHILLLDNFSLQDLEKAVRMIGERARTEASGGISLDSLKQIAETGVDFISTGALTHSSIWMDVGLDWR